MEKPRYTILEYGTRVYDAEEMDAFLEEQANLLDGGKPKPFCSCDECQLRWKVARALRGKAKEKEARV